ncbi:MAG: hypothetical protein ACI8UO_004840 [Verrucomicrobiales bacterium]|jgi:hypothetical protein
MDWISPPETFDGFQGGYTDEQFEARKRLIAERRVLYDRFATAMLRHPSLAAYGFSCISRMRSHEEGEAANAELVEMARQALLLMDADAFISSSYFQHPSLNHWAIAKEPDRRIRHHGPVEFLVQTLGRSGDREQLAEVVNELRAIPEKADLARIIECWSELYLSEPASYLEAVNALTEAWKYEDKQPIFIVPIVEIWKERGLKVDLFPWAASIFDKVENIGAQSSDLRAAAVCELAHASAESEGSEFVDRCLEWAAERYLGPKEGRQKRIADASADDGSADSDEEAFLVEARWMIPFLNQLGTHPVMNFASVEKLIELELQENGGYEPLIALFVEDTKWRASDQGISMLNHSPFATSLADFHPIVPDNRALQDGLGFGRGNLLNRGTSKTLAGKMGSMINRSAERTAYLEWALGHPENAFAARLLAATLTEEESGQEFIRVLNQFGDQIKAMDADRRLGIALFVSDLAALVIIPDGAAEELGIWIQLDDLAKSILPTAEQLLAAETISDLKDISAANFTSYLVQLIQPRISRKQEEALAIFKRGLEIEIASRRQGLWANSFGPGETLGGEVLEQLMNRGHTLKTLRFIADVCYAEEILPTEIQPNAHHLNSQIYGVYSRSEDEDPPQTPQSFALIARKFADIETIPLALGICENLLDDRADEEIPAVLAWSRTAEATQLHPGLARDLEAAAQIRLNGIDKTEEPLMSAEAADFYVSILRDESIPIAIRLERATYHVSDFYSEPTPAVVLAAGDCLASAWENFLPTYFYSAQSISSAFAAMEADETWTRTAKRLIAAFKLRYTNEEPPARLVPEPDRDCVQHMIVIALKSGNVEDGLEILNCRENEIGSMFEVFAHLVRAGELNRAVRLMRNHLEELDARKPQGSNQWHPELGVRDPPVSIRWTPEFAASVQQLLETIESPSQRFFAETLLASVEDSDPPAPGKNRSERLADVAQRFAKTGGSSRGGSIREKTLEQLAEYPESPRFIGNLLWQFSDPLRLSWLADNSNSDWNTRAYGLLYKTVLQSLEAGDFDRFEILFERANSLAPERDRRAKRTLSGIAAQIAALLKDPALDKTKAKNLLPKLCELALSKENQYARNGVYEYVGWLMFTAEYAGAWESVDEWFAGLDEASAARLLKNGRDLTTTFAFAGIHLKSKPVEERIAWAQSFLSQPLVEAILEKQNGSRFSSIFQGKLLSSDEMIQHGEAMAEADLRGGRAWIDLAKYFEAIERDYDKSLHYWDRALAEIPSQDVEGRARSQIGKTQQLLKLERTSEAKTAFEAIDLGKIPRSLKFVSQQLSRTLGMPTD